MNTKKVLQKFNESIKEFLDMPEDEFKKLLDISTESRIQVSFY